MPLCRGVPGPDAGYDSGGLADEDGELWVVLLDGDVVFADEVPHALTRRRLLAQVDPQLPQVGSQSQRARHYSFFDTGSTAHPSSLPNR